LLQDPQNLQTPFAVPICKTVMLPTFERPRTNRILSLLNKLFEHTPDCFKTIFQELRHFHEAASQTKAWQLQEIALLKTFSSSLLLWIFLSNTWGHRKKIPWTELKMNSFRIHLFLSLARPYSNLCGYLLCQTVFPNAPKWFLFPAKSRIVSVPRLPRGVTSELRPGEITILKMWSRNRSEDAANFFSYSLFFLKKCTIFFLFWSCNKSRISFLNFLDFPFVFQYLLLRSIPTRPPLILSWAPLDPCNSGRTPFLLSNPKLDSFLSSWELFFCSFLWLKTLHAFFN